jgi:hypothetical protein
MSDSCREKGSDKILIKASSIRTKFLIANTQESAKSPFYQEFIVLQWFGSATNVGSGRCFGRHPLWILGFIFPMLGPFVGGTNGGSVKLWKAIQSVFLHFSKGLVLASSSRQIIDIEQSFMSCR